MKRIKLKPRRPNALFELWLEEWRKEAASNNSDLEYHFSKALSSLRKYPLPLKSGKDCIILQHFGKKLCLMLDRKLAEQKENKDSTSADNFVDIHRNHDEHYVPAKKHRSLTQQVVADVGFMRNKNEGSNKSSKLYKSKSADCIIIEGHKEPIDKDFVEQKTKKNNLLLKKVQEKTKEANNLSNNKTDSFDNLPKNVYLESKKFEIILLVDTQETCGGKTKPQHDATIMELTQLEVLFEVRHLKVGDFAWIARCRSTNNELILPYIVERKRIDDLSASITDGRFHEQKFRLKQSGITNLMYIIEEYEKGKRLTIPHSSLMQASINTLIQDGFSVKYTKSHKDSMFYLSSLTRILIKLFKEKELIGCRKDAITQTDISNNTCNLMQFDEFNKAASKQKVFKVSEMFVRQLLQLKGMSVEKASAIVKHYPTPRVLTEAFRKSDGNGELLLANINFNDKKRLIGPAISKTIYQLYTQKNLS